MKAKHNQQEKQPSFSLDHLNSDAFLRRLDEVKNGSDDMIMIIPCTKEEFDRFDV